MADMEDENVKQPALANWVLSKITGTVRQDGDLIEPSFWEMLGEGQYTNEPTGEVLRFTLPEDMYLPISATTEEGSPTGSATAEGEYVGA
ncbi:MAG: hypothetical protein ACLP7O_00325 [Terracidiphilus sp.]